MVWLESDVRWRRHVDDGLANWERREVNDAINGNRWDGRGTNARMGVSMGLVAPIWLTCATSTHQLPFRSAAKLCLTLQFSRSACRSSLCGHHCIPVLSHCSFLLRDSLPAASIPCVSISSSTSHDTHTASPSSSSITVLCSLALTMLAPVHPSSVHAHFIYSFRFLALAAATRPALLLPRRSSPHLPIELPPSFSHFQPVSSLPVCPHSLCRRIGLAPSAMARMTAVAMLLPGLLVALLLAAAITVITIGPLGRDVWRATIAEDSPGAFHLLVLYSALATLLALLWGMGVTHTQVRAWVHQQGLAVTAGLMKLKSATKCRVPRGAVSLPHSPM
ncbi:unnamed protein product [Closterium sp. NIES-64]|nr:unnamed protein product [Closterium sp. NIES-64]